MKKIRTSYKKMLIFQFALFLIFFLNSFVSNILGGYNFVIFLIVSLVLFKFLFGFERDKGRYTRDVILEICIYLMIFFILFYLFGIVIGFARTSEYLTWYGFKTFIIPLTLTILLKEFLRYNMLRKCEDSRELKIIIFILFVFLDLTEVIYYGGFNNNYSTFIFIALSLLPAISRNLVLNYISIRVGYRPIYVYLLITNLYAYLIPIIPNPNEYITSIIQLVIPVFLWARLHTFFKREEDRYVDRNYKKINLPMLILPALFTAVMVYFTSGYFHYYALAVASGSMEPKISKGDLVIVEKIDDKYDKLEVGQVIVYKYNKVVIVHRLVKIVKEKEKYYFYTKGDANGAEDNYAIPEENIIGTTNFKIPYLGLPTVWLNEQ